MNQITNLEFNVDICLVFRLVGTCDLIPLKSIECPNVRLIV